MITTKTAKKSTNEIETKILKAICWNCEKNVKKKIANRWKQRKQPNYNTNIEHKTVTEIEKKVSK